jgi:hypothetical protein
VCLYVQPLFGVDNNPQENLYRAIYLRHLSAKNFLDCLAKKCEVAESQIVEAIMVNKDGHHIFDDNIVSKFTDGQDMVVKFQEVELSQTKLSSLRDIEVCSSFEVENGRKVSKKYYRIQLIC